MSKPIFNTPYQAAPFSEYKTEDYRPAIAEAIIESLAEVDAIAHNTAPATFENTIAALAYSGEKLDRLSSMFFNLNSAETNEIMQQEAQHISPMLTQYSNDILLNAALFERVRAVYEQRECLQLSPEEDTLLTKTYKNFVRNGALLSEEKKSELRAIDKELSLLQLRFGENVLAENNAYELHLTEEAQLAGLPEAVREVAAALARERGKEGWLFTLDFPSYSAFIKYADLRDLRKQLFIAYHSRGFHKEYNNEENVKQIVALRHQRAQLLGYATYADFVLEERMAQSPAKVTNFLSELLAAALPVAQRELEALAAAAKADGITDLQKWDFPYYTEKLRQQRFNIDEQALKPYFALDKVLAGVFAIAGRLYGLQFERITDVEVYHQEVATYKVTDAQGAYVALLYTDFFPRAGKRGGAWMTSFKNQHKRDGENARPHISIVCNFTRPTVTEPSLLTMNEVRTLFHEFGHALHGMLADTSYPTLSGTSVLWDFVELPSQLMENWAYEEDALQLFAYHYKTGEPLPMDYVRKLKEAAVFMEGLQTLRQLSFGFLDMAWHTADPAAISSVQAFERTATEKAELFPPIDALCISTAFSHIFQGGYAAGYYSYKWAEVLDADAFAHFTATGIFNKETANSFKHNVLSRGGSEPPMVLYKRFRGQEPSTAALLKRAFGV